MEECELDGSGSGKGTVVGFCKQGKQSSGSIKREEFLN
jgi:hypothetical protein